MPTVVNVGDVLAGKYRVERVLGFGGMGMVVSAMHLELDQHVALKFMLPDSARVAQHVERFIREAKAVVKLRSAHVCRVLDVGRLEDGAPYIVMELLEGEDLSSLLDARSVLPAGEAVDLVLQAIEGVAEAHANQIVHRDLKPANLFVTTERDGSPLVKVLDFGISKSSAAGAATKTGEIMGSPTYMAPEQLMSSKDVDARADLWALGVILYQAVTGQLPFDAETLPALCMAVLNDRPRPPIEVRGDLPPGLSDVIMCCLEKKPEERFADLGALSNALARFGGPEAPAAVARIQKLLRHGIGRGTEPNKKYSPPTPVPQPMPELPPTTGSPAATFDGASTEPGPYRHTPPPDSTRTIPPVEQITPYPPPPDVQDTAPELAKQSKHAPHSTTLSASSAELTGARRPPTKLPLIAAALTGLAVLAVIMVVVLRGDSSSTPKQPPKTAAATEAPPPAPEPETPSVRRRPKLQVTQLTDDAPEVKAIPIPVRDTSSAAAPPRPTTSVPLAPKPTTATPATGSASMATSATPTGPAPAPQDDAKSLASLLQQSGFVGKWLAQKLGDKFLVKSLGPKATLQIVSNPTGASVTYEGAVIGKTPLSIEVERGAYDILVDLALEGRVDRTVLIPAMFDATTQVEMPEPAALKLLSKPAGADVEVAGEVIGKTPLEIKVPPDEPQVFLLRLENYEDKVVELAPTKSTTETVVLEKKLQQIVHELDSVPSGVEVVLDGQVVGKTPYKTDFLEVRGGTRQYTLRAPGERYRDTAVRVPADKPQKRVVKLRDICNERAPEVASDKPSIVNPYDPCRNR
jgi:serine/threonine-protein kinase